MIKSAYTNVIQINLQKQIIQVIYNINSTLWNRVKIVQVSWAKKTISVNKEFRLLYFKIADSV